MTGPDVNRARRAPPTDPAAQRPRKALITGLTGQDGSYLAELLLSKGYEVHSIKRRASLFNTQRVDHIYEDPHVERQRFVLHYGDLTDSSNLTRILQQVQPDEVYNLGAQSHVAVSFINVGTGIDCTIRELAQTVAHVTGLWRSPALRRHQTRRDATQVDGRIKAHRDGLAGRHRPGRRPEGYLSLVPVARCAGATLMWQRATASQHVTGSRA